MRIAIDIRAVFGPRTGKGEYTLQVLKGLFALDPKNQYYLYCQRRVAIRRPNVRIIALRVPSFLWHLFVWLDLKLRLRPDVYFAPTSYLIPALGLKNCVLVVHDLIALLFPERHNQKAVWLEKIFLKQALQKARKIITVSKATKCDLVRMFALDPKKILVIYEAVAKRFRKLDPRDPYLRSIKAKFNLPPRFVFFVGTLEPRKNLKRLIKAFSKLADQDISLVIAGGKGWHYQEIFTLVQKLGLEQRVRFLGYVLPPDLPYLYNCASLFVFPSLYEGFGLPPLEAMACGTPVLASNAASLPEVVDQAAYQVSPQKEVEIARGITLLLERADLRRKLIQRGYQQARKFSWKKTARAVLSVLQSVKSNDAFD